MVLIDCIIIKLNPLNEYITLYNGITVYMYACIHITRICIFIFSWWLANLTIFLLPTDLTWVCGSSDTCDVYALDYDSYYLEYDCDSTQLIGTQYSPLDDDACIPISVFGFEFAYYVETFTDTSYTLSLYNESTTLTRDCGFSTELVFEEGCCGNETLDTSTDFYVTPGSSSGSGGSAARSQFNGIFAIA